MKTRAQRKADRQAKRQWIGFIVILVMTLSIVTAMVMAYINSL